MKKQTLILSFFLITFNLTSLAQVTLEDSYFTSQAQSPREFYLTNIGNDNYKYVLYDTAKISLYNLDHSPYLLNYVSPVQLLTSPQYYRPAYITTTLFDCDSTTLEFVIASDQNSNASFLIYRTDGTLLFSRDSVLGPYCYGCNVGSVIKQPIKNTSQGAKLFLFNVDSTWVYSLCGSLPVNVPEISIDESYVKVYPNPSDGMINFQIKSPSNTEKFTLTIYDSSFQVIDEKIVTDSNFQLNLKARPYSAGTYLFDLRTDRKVIQTGKFVITR